MRATAQSDGLMLACLVGKLAWAERLRRVKDIAADGSALGRGLVESDGREHGGLPLGDAAN